MSAHMGFIINYAQFGPYGSFASLTCTKLCRDQFTFVTMAA